MDVLIIGAGLFGCCAAIELAQAGFNIDLIDSEADIMQQASRVNHNRVHLGYHYLRSIETAEQSLEGLISFMLNYGSAVESQFNNYYAIAKQNSRTSPEEFLNFCEKVKIHYDHAYPDEKFFNKEMLSACFKVPEPVFDYISLKKKVQENLIKSKANLLLNHRLTLLEKTNDHYTATYNTISKEYEVVINASYANFNNINALLGIPPKKLQYDRVMIPEFKYSSSPFGLTIMDGAFCSVMPKGKLQNEFLLYHVKHSVLESDFAEQRPVFSLRPEIRHHEIYENSEVYMPFLSNVTKNGYKEVVRVINKNHNDARLTELFTYDDFNNYFALLSGKITTCVQLGLEIKHILQGKKGVQRSTI
jgi:hypothetical protein